jgi:hypothetical protein
MFLGKLIFKALGITVADFQVAGGRSYWFCGARSLDVSGEKKRAPEAFGIAFGLPLMWAGVADHASCPHRFGHGLHPFVADSQPRDCGDRFCRRSPNEMDGQTGNQRDFQTVLAPPRRDAVSLIRRGMIGRAFAHLQGRRFITAGALPSAILYLVSSIAQWIVIGRPLTQILGLF